MFGWITTGLGIIALLLAVIFSVMAIAKAAFAWVILAIASVVFAFAMFFGAPWWVSVGIAMVGVGALLLWSKAFAIGAIVTAIAALLFIVGPIWSPTTAPAAALGQMKGPVTGSGTPVPGDCPKEFEQNFDKNEKGNFSSVPIDNENDVLALAGRDARYLGFTLQRLGIPNSPEWKVLMVGTVPGKACLSREGMNFWYQVKGMFTAPGVKVDRNGEAPADFHNTGMSGGHAVVDPKPGIGGDRHAVVITFPNGVQVFILKRCANYAIRSKEGLPEGETDHQRPSTTVPGTPGTTVPSTPPVTTTENNGKVHTQDPAEQNNAAGASGRNQNTGTDEYKPPPTFQTPPYTPKPPPPAGPPKGGTTTKVTTPPPEPSVNPTSGNNTSVPPPTGW